jgi:hypothetical protein
VLMTKYYSCLLDHPAFRRVIFSFSN